MDAQPNLRWIFSALALITSALLVNLPASATVLHEGTRVSDAALTGNSIAAGNTSRNLAVGSDGTIYAVFHGVNGIRVARSGDRGQSFGASVEVSAVDAEAEIAVSVTGIVYVTWADSNGRAQVSRSLDGAQSFAAPVDAGAAIATLHMATDASWVYLVERQGVSFFRSADNGLTFETVTVGPGDVYADVHVDPDTGDVILQMDDPDIKYHISTDHGATFTARIFPNPAGAIYYSVAGLSVGPAGRFLIVSGGGLGSPSTDGLRIDIDSGVLELLTFGSNAVSQGRSIETDRCGNVVDGYVDGTDLKFHVSNDLGDTFAPEVTIASVPDFADQNSNVFIDQTTGNVLFLYSQAGEVFLNVYERELRCYEPQLSVSALAFSAQFVGTTSTAHTVTLTNSGALAMEITGVTASGDFASSSQCVGTLAPGASCDVSVTFSPTAVGTLNGRIDVSTNIFAEPRVVSLTGLGVQTAPAPEFSQSEIDFGIRLLDTPVRANVTLRNAGNQNLAVNGFSVSGGFTFTHSCPATLAPDESCLVHLRFAADAIGAYAGRLLLDSNAPGAPAAVELSGEGTNGFLVTAEIAEGNGTVLPESVMVVGGQTHSFTISPELGYVLSGIEGCGGDVTGSTFTTAPITEACTIRAWFAVKVTATGKGGGGSLDFLMLGGLLLPLLLRFWRRPLAVAALLFALPALAQAEDFSRWFAGASVGNARTDVTSSDLNARLDDLGYDVDARVGDRTRTAWEIHGGFRYSEYLATRVGYTDLGTVDATFSGSALDIAGFLRDANRILPHSASGFDLKVVGSYPLLKRLAVTAQLGGFAWSADYKVSNSSGESVQRNSHGTDLVIGAGLEFEVLGSTSLTAGWTRNKIGSESVNLLSVGVQYSWPRKS